ncbi:hypothetical protein C1645_832573 [Glomus cerebriforme]|uniref:Uncharacterized protein n=1 Tax=Glomus cerebriforme TaxID=658196 RepID=A0A397S8M6_9GLOM|nr:hypothetical protein C1645_838308 [Glomus cerebriforme]RIA84245.1 hypothetical protein C1645_832573 [Glomus cerebriforme]
MDQSNNNPPFPDKNPNFQQQNDITSDPNFYQQNNVAMNSNQFNQHYQSPQESDIFKPLNIINEYRFFYKPFNDFQIYNVFFKEITVEKLLDNYNDSIYNYIQSNYLHVFCFIEPISKKIYHVSCEMISHFMIVQFLNKTVHNIELSSNEYQQQPYMNEEFSNEHRRNLEFHLKNFLINYLVPNQIHEKNYNSNYNSNSNWDIMQNNNFNSINNSDASFVDNSSFRQYQ